MERSREAIMSDIEFQEQLIRSETESYCRIAAGSYGAGLNFAQESHKSRMESLRGRVRQLQDELLNSDPNIKRSRKNAAREIVGIWGENGDLVFYDNGKCSKRISKDDFIGNYSVADDGSGNIVANFGEKDGIEIGTIEFNLQGNVLMQYDGPNHPRIELKRNFSEERRREEARQQEQKRADDLKKRKQEHKARMDEIASAIADKEKAQRLQPIRERAKQYQGCITSNARLTENGRVIWAIDIPMPHNSKKTWKGKTGKWRNIIAISESDDNILGLKSNGRVVFAGSVVRYTSARRKIKKFRDIVRLSDYPGSSGVFALKSDGTVISDSVEPSLKNWDSIISIAYADYYYVGLKKDGTVVAAEKRHGGGRKVDGSTDNWRDIVAIAAAKSHIVGLKADGRVVAVGMNNKGQCNTQNWQDIISIAVHSSCTIGLRANGTVVATGENDGLYNSWKDIIAIFDGGFALKVDGTIAGRNNNICF